ncbi:hypothetical protein NDU88_002313 [Pleurodeles waltl]|uniref:DUF397 domain-containing protein n=1 Tax=Pleurodeles waltl TaxID=8319 RepID=A0AAV7UA57_PLEWA|nr:hypothetical protein NDU88_002313 [Pleurodeles waltl]
MLCNHRTSQALSPEAVLHLPTMHLKNDTNRTKGSFALVLRDAPWLALLEAYKDCPGGVRAWDDCRRAPDLERLFTAALKQGLLCQPGL